MKEYIETSTFALFAGDGAFDLLEDGVRRRVRDFIEAILEEELRAALGRGRYERTAEGARGQRNGHRERRIVGTFGAETVKVPRARMIDEDGQASEWRSRALRRYQRLTKKAEALIAAVYLAGTNTRRVKRALFGLFDGAASKDVVSRAWRKVKTDWEAWCARSLAEEDVVRRSPSPSNRWRSMAQPGRHRGQDPDRPEGDVDLGARGHRGAPGRAESAAFDQKHGW
jgi:putative transposase